MSFQKKLLSGDFVVLAEFHPPKGVDVSDLSSNIIRIKGRVDGVIVPEMAIEAKTIADIDELTLLRAVKGLQNGIDMAGMELKGSPQFVTGCSIKPAKKEMALKAELELAQKKVKEGAQFIVTPPVFNIPAFTYFMEHAKGLGVPVIATVFLLKSVGVARYIATNVPGPPMPEEFISRIRKAPDRITECLSIAAELVSSLKELCQGVQLVTMGWENRLPAILDAANI